MEYSPHEYLSVLLNTKQIGKHWPLKGSVLGTYFLGSTQIEGFPASLVCVMSLRIGIALIMGMEYMLSTERDIGGCS